ncbi:hypothetical protein Lser_V15G17082 [Lactuca serriola]
MEGLRHEIHDFVANREVLSFDKAVEYARRREHNLEIHGGAFTIPKHPRTERTVPVPSFLPAQSVRTEPGVDDEEEDANDDEEVDDKEDLEDEEDDLATDKGESSVRGMNSPPNLNKHIQFSSTSSSTPSVDDINVSNKFDSLSTKLSLDNTLNVENVSEFDGGSDMSEISMENEVDCLEFVKSEPKPAKSLISKNSVEYFCISENGSKVLKEKATVSPKTKELLSLVEKDNDDGCDEHFWSTPINNAESKATNNKEDELKKIIDDTAKDIEHESPTLKRSDIPSPPQATKALHLGEGFTSTSSTDKHVQGEDEAPEISLEPSFQGEDSTSGANEQPNPSFEGENENTNDDSNAKSEFEEVNDEQDPSYDPNYHPLTKWTRDHSKSQLIREASVGVLMRAQQKANQAVLFSKMEFCVFNPFISKIEPKNIKIALDHSHWVQTMQEELNEFE